MKEQDLNSIINELEKTKGELKFLNLFFLADASQIYQLCLKEFKSSSYEQLPLLNYITNIVSWLEQFFKYFFIVSIDELKISPEQMVGRIKKKLNFSELYKLVSSDLTIGRVTAEYFNFQKLSDVESAFTNLLKIDNQSFFDLFQSKYDVILSKTRNRGVGNQFILTVGPIMEKINFYPLFRNLIQHRHEFIHKPNQILSNENINNQLKNMISEFESVYLSMIIIMTSILADRTNKSPADILTIVKML